MSKIHISSPSGEKSEYEEDEIKSMWKRGLIQSDAFYWKEGMSDWKPVADYFSASDTLPSTQLPIPENGTTTYTFTKDPRSLTSFLIFMLWLSLGSKVISILSDFGQMSLLAQESFTQAEAEANDERQGLVGIAFLIIFIITGVVFLKWIYRANLNSRGFGAKDMKFTPGWSIGYYFIPILNLYKPYQSMEEIWRVSKDPVNYKPYQSMKESLLYQTEGKEENRPLLLWWSFWLGANFIAQLTSNNYQEAETVEALKNATYVSILSSLIWIMLCIYAVKLVKTITDRQRALTKCG